MIKSITGAHDLYPPQVAHWRFIEETARRVFELFRYEEIRTPLLEATELFERGIGTETGVVKKEMYTFDDKGGESVTLRPEGTASVVRALIEHNLDKRDPILKLFYMGPMFRYERPQKGRLRQFHQIGAELFGAKGSQADVEMISLADTLVRKMGVARFELQINTLGCQTQAGLCRHAYGRALQEYFQAQEGYCPDCQRRMKDNPLRIFDCKVEACRSLSQKAPTIFTYLCDTCGPHFEQVKRGLDSLKIPYVVNPRIARGLDYYDQTAFELISGDLGAQNAFGGGGRYNGLVKSLSGPDLPAVGFALGVERLVLLSEGIYQSPSKTQVFVACLGAKAFEEATQIMQNLRAAGIACDRDYEEKSLKSQMRRADKLGFSHVIILGDQEILSQKAQVKDLKNQTQTEVAFGDLTKYF